MCRMIWIIVLGKTIQEADQINMPYFIVSYMHGKMSSLPRFFLINTAKVGQIPKGLIA